MSLLKHCTEAGGREERRMLLRAWWPSTNFTRFHFSILGYASETITEIIIIIIIKKRDSNDRHQLTDL